MQLEDLREGRYRHVGNPTNRLPSYPLAAFRITNRVDALVAQGIRGISTAQHASSIRSSALNFAMHGVASALIMNPSKHGSVSLKTPKPVKAT